MRSIYVELPAEEARKRLGNAAPGIARMLASFDDCRIEFVPAQGGCVIAVFPMAPTPKSGRTLALLNIITTRLKQRSLEPRLRDLSQALQSMSSAA